MAAFETGLKLLTKTSERSKNVKYLNVDYEKVDFLSHKILDFLSKKEKLELTCLSDKFEGQSKIVESLMDQRLTMRKNFHEI